LDKRQILALLEPWLGTRPGDTIDDLPIPALIDLRLARRASGHGPGTAGTYRSFQLGRTKWQV